MRLGLPKRIQFYLMPAGALLQAVLPRSLSLCLAAIAVRLLFPLLRNQRQKLRENFFRLIEPEPSRGGATKVRDHQYSWCAGARSRAADAYACRVLINLAMASVDLLRVPLLVRQRSFDRLLIGHEYSEQLARVLSNNRAAILVTAHIGNWDLAGAFLAFKGYPIAAIFERIPRGMSEVYNRFRGASGMMLIGMDERDRMVTALRSGKLLVLLGDRDLKGTGEKLPWFGGMRKFPRGAAVLALRYNVPVVIGYFVFEPSDRQRRYRAVVEPPLQFTPSGDMARDVSELTGLIVRELERIVRQYPDQWLVLRPDWL